jgi:4-amino-4-deoxy-L-arabinose transferase-like glycosyltransferase
MLALLGLWLVVYGCSCWGAPLLDDADATHAQAAQAMLASGDWVTLHVDGVRYLEKAPLPYWITAVSLKVFGENAFAVHFPLALTVLALALLGWRWSGRAFGETAGWLTAMFTLTAAGVFLFTRVFLPDALLSLFLALALYGMVRATVRDSARYAYLMWGALACAVLSKGLVALVFVLGTATLLLTVTREWRSVGKLRPMSGVLVLLAIAAPWHVLAGLRNPGGAGGHGFFWFYFVNEHVLRFLGRREPRDYNKLPALAYWSLHLVWLFPWSLFAPAAVMAAWRGRGRGRKDEAAQTRLVLVLFSALVMVFFSLSTNQEYYTFPVYLPLLMLLAFALTEKGQSRRALGWTFAAMACVGTVLAAVLAYGLWSSRGLAFNPDIGALLAHRSVGNYTLSMSHFFDLTEASFAALRLPAAMAAVVLLVGPVIALLVFRRRGLQAGLVVLGATSAVFLVAAHLALMRFAPMLSSKDFAERIAPIEGAEPGTETMIYGDQAFGSSLPFYLRHRVLLVDGRTTSMEFGSTFADAPPVFLTHEQLAAEWGTGARKLLFVPPDRRDDVQALLGARAVMLFEESGKTLLTDRPLTAQAAARKETP